MSTQKIKVNLNPPANAFSVFSERIVEFSSPGGGGLISFRLTANGLVADVYREDETVEIRVNERHWRAKA